MSKERNCDQCQKPYHYKMETSKYCSGSCRAKAAVNKKGLGETPTAKETKAPERRHFDTPQDMGPQAQYIISQSAKEADRWEKLYNETRTELKEKEKEEKKLREELTQIKNDQKIAEASGPGGLSGLMDTPGFGQIMQYIGPVIQKIAEKGVDWATNPTNAVAQISGPGGDANNPLAQFAQWLASLDENTRLQVWQLMQYLSSLPPNDLQMMLLQFENMGILTQMRKTG